MDRDYGYGTHGTGEFMTEAKEEAIGMCEEFHDTIRLELMEHGEVMYYGALAKKCALICVDEIMGTIHESDFWGTRKYWQQVKEEIEKL